MKIDQLNLSFPQGDPLSQLGPRIAIEGAALINLDRQRVSAQVWPSTDAPDPTTGFGYFYVWVLFTSGRWRERGKKHIKRIRVLDGPASVDATKRPIRLDYLARTLDRMYSAWRSLTWQPWDVKPLDYNLMLYTCREQWFSEEVLGKEWNPPVPETKGPESA
ncbi:MAG TPA: hypothetical protein VMV27_14410 [Candidatus Binataceae bacterium]|nr:hypothetical protein [Candidatus Binataceae bacterium]